MDLVIAIYWLTTGEPAFDYRPKLECEQLAAVTQSMGGMMIELQDGQMLPIERVECKPRIEPATVRAPS